MSLGYTIKLLKKFNTHQNTNNVPETHAPSGTLLVHTAYLPTSDIVSSVGLLG